MRKPNTAKHVGRGNDPLGQALLDGYKARRQGKPCNLQIAVHADLVEQDVIAVDYLFRDWLQMPALEQHALELCFGKVLDVGAGSGCHSRLLQQRGLTTLSIDTSPGACQVMALQGIPVIAQSLAFMPNRWNGCFDTIILLMNGLGLAGSRTGLSQFLAQLKLLLKPGGQVLIDSSDFDEDAADFAEIVYQLVYRTHTSAPFSWLFLPYQALAVTASEQQLTSECIHSEPDGSYLARLCKPLDSIRHDQTQ